MAQTAMKLEDQAAEDAAEIDLRILDEVRANPVIVLLDESKRTTFYAAVEAEAVKKAGTEFDSQDGLDRVRSAAYGIARLKSAIDKAGKEQTEEWRKKTGEINVQRKQVETALDAIQARVRAPATEFEVKESARKKEADDLIEKLRAAAIITIVDNIESVQTRLDDIRGININNEVMRDRTEMAVDLRDEAVKALSEALAGLKQQAEERAELARLREERERREAEEAERARQQQEQAAAALREQEEAERIQREKDEAAERAVRETEERAAAEKAEIERKAREERDALERAKQAEIDEANERARLAEEAARQEREDAEAARRAEEEQRAAEAEQQRQREADRTHRSRIMGEAKKDIMSCGVDEPTAKAIVTAIVAKQIAHTSITF